MSEQEQTETKAQEESNTKQSGKRSTPRSQMGRLFVFLVYGLVTSGMVLAIFHSIYQHVSTPPKIVSFKDGKHQIMKASHVKQCVKGLRALNEELETESKHLWYRMRHGNRHYVAMWEAWGKDWRKRLKKLMKQCPLGTQKLQTQKSARVNVCTTGLKKLENELEKKRAIWLSGPRGPKRDLRKWKDWGKDWRQRTNALINRCPIYGQNEIARAFQRASKRMLVLQKRQEKAFSKFFGESSWLFRDIRQSLHILKEELR